VQTTASFSDHHIGPLVHFLAGLACRFVPASGGAHAPDTSAERGRTGRDLHKPWQKPGCRTATSSARFCEFWGVLSPNPAEPPEFPARIGGVPSTMDPWVDLWPAQIAISSRRSDARPDPSRPCLYAPLLPRVGSSVVQPARVPRGLAPQHAGAAKNLKGGAGNPQVLLGFLRSLCGCHPHSFTVGVRQTRMKQRSRLADLR
jgi:hypothetical protein